MLSDKALYYSRIYRIAGILILLAGLVFLFNNFPFRCSKFSQYEGSLGIKPYQHFIDYVRDRGGLTFWAHPEARNYQRIGIISTETSEHTSDLLQADNYSGFAIFYEGYKDTTCLVETDSEPPHELNKQRLASLSALIL